MTSAESSTGESNHVTPNKVVGWVAQHILAHIEELPAFCARHGLDSEKEASLRSIYEIALEELERLPQDKTLVNAAGDVFYRARDTRDEIMGIRPRIDE